jgi:hypothetical protein
MVGSLGAGSERTSSTAFSAFLDLNPLGVLRPTISNPAELSRTLIRIDSLPEEPPPVGVKQSNLGRVVHLDRLAIGTRNHRLDYLRGFVGGRESPQ